MRPVLALAPHLALVLALAPALLPLATAQPGGPVATLGLVVQPDHSETGTLSFEGIRALTRYESICLPERATETRVYDDVGDVQYDGRSENGRRTLSFLARSSVVRIDLTRAAPSDVDHPLYASDVNFCVPTDSSVVVKVDVPEGHTLFFMTGATTLNARSGTSRADGPTHVFYSYEAPLDGRKPMTLLEIEPFRVFVSTPLAPKAEEIARLSAGPLRAALAEAGLALRFDALRLLYSETTPFAWEAGHYNGHGYIQVKEESLTADATTGYPISSVRVVVHESFHAASFPYGKGSVEDEIAWWLEGTAKHSERHVDAALPNATRHCAKTTAEVRCWDFDDRIREAEVDAAYADTFRFNTEWEPSLPQDDDTRRFYYAYSEYVVSAWIERHGQAEYARVWDDITAAFDEDRGCPCGDDWLETVLDDPDLYQPWQDIRAGDPEEFHATIQPLVKDEEALQRELDRQANPLSGLGIPAPAWTAIGAGAIAAVAWRHGRRRSIR